MSAIMSNNGDARLAASLSTSDTTMQLKPGHGARFAAIPSGSWTPLTIVDSAGNFEIVRATAKSGDTFTIVREQEGTTARAFAVDAVVQNRPTAAVYDDVFAAIATAQAAADNSLQKSDNLASLADKPNARENLSVYSRSEIDNALLGIASVPVGAVAPFATNAAPSGWLKCNGAAVSRATYAALFAAIGTTFGAGDGSTTFNLPDLRGEFVRGLDDGRGVDAGRGIGTGQSDQNKSHTHTGTTDSGGAHTHSTHSHTSNSYTNNGSATGGGVVAGGEQTGSAGAHTHTFTTAASGGTEARPRNIALLYCIKF